jgi:hypothetical protein
MLAAATFGHHGANLLSGLPGDFLDAPDQLLLLAFDVLQIVIGELGELLLKSAPGDIPVALELECDHNVFGLGAVYICHPLERELKDSFACGVPRG